MWACICGKSVFPTCDNEENNCRPTLTSATQQYNPKVKIHDWQERLLSRPHDNCSRCLTESTYKRLGTDDAPIGISTTRAMTEQINTKADCAAQYRHRRLLNIYSFPYTQTDEYKKELKMISSPKPSKHSEPIDYRTTLKDDFPNHYPEKDLPPLSPHHVSPRTYVIHRRTLGYNDYDIDRRDGFQHFWDVNTNPRTCAPPVEKPKFVY